MWGEAKEHGTTESRQFPVLAIEIPQNEEIFGGKNREESVLLSVKEQIG